MNNKNWLSQNTHSLSGKLVAVSGSTGGIGEELVKYLAALGADLLLLDRNSIKANALMDTLNKECPSLSVRHIPLDLENIESVRAALPEIKKAAPDFLVLNAGAYHIPRRKSALNLENVFQINFLSPYFLARELKEIGAHIVAVSSIALFYSKTDENDIDFSSRTKSNLIYGNSKRYLTSALFSLFEGSERLSIVHPGITFTNITAHYPPLIFAIIKHPMKVIFMSRKKAALSVLKGLFDHTKNGEWIGPCAFNIWGLPKKQKLNFCDKKEAAFIKKTADKLCNQMKKAD